MKKKMKGPMGLKWRIENDKDKRIQAILDDMPVRFEIHQTENPSYKMSLWDDLYNADKYGKNAVRKHDAHIQEYSKERNIDPDVVKAIMYAENARGHEFWMGNEIADISKISDSPWPMNIDKHKWSRLIDKQPEDMYDEDNNINASVLLLRRIADRIDHPTPEKIGSIWHYIGAESTDKFGHYIGDIYRKKPW